MELVLTSRDGVPVVEIEDAAGKSVLYRYRVESLPFVWSVTLTALDPETGEPAVDRQGRPREYRVTVGSLGEWCGCKDFLCRRLGAGERCKHLRAAVELRKHWLAMTGATAS